MAAAELTSRPVPRPGHRSIPPASHGGAAGAPPANVGPRPRGSAALQRSAQRQGQSGIAPRPQRGPSGVAVASCQTTRHSCVLHGLRMASTPLAWPRLQLTEIPKTRAACCACRALEPRSAELAQAQTACQRIAWLSSWKNRLQRAPDQPVAPVRSQNAARMHAPALAQLRRVSQGTQRLAWPLLQRGGRPERRTGAGAAQAAAAQVRLLPSGHGNRHARAAASRLQAGARSARSLAWPGPGAERTPCCGCRPRRRRPRSARQTWAAS